MRLKKTCVWFILLLSFQAAIIRAQSSWSDPILVVWANNPDLAIDRQRGLIHVVGLNNGVRYAVLDTLGNVQTEYKVPKSGTDYGRMNFGVSIDVDSQGFPHVVYKVPREEKFFDVFYVRKDTSGWRPKVSISARVWRGYVIRVAVDGSDRVHIARGRADWETEPTGFVNVYRAIDGNVVQVAEDLSPYRADDRLEIDAEADGTVHMVLGNPKRNQAAVPYFRSLDGGENWYLVADIHNSAQCTNRNGCPDIFVDLAGNVHMTYGTNIDQSADGKGSIRYVRFNGNVKVRDVRVTRRNDVKPWKYNAGWGLSSVASSDDGQWIVVAYLTKGEGSAVNDEPGDLYVTMSSDGGVTWSESEFMAPRVGSSEGRNIHKIRAYNNHFYLVYPQGDQIKLRVLRHVGDTPPTAVSGGPYSGQEGDSLLLDMSGSYDTGMNPSILEYAWDWGDDETYDFITDSPIIKTMFHDDFEGPARLRVTDFAGLRDWDLTQISIQNVSPTVDLSNDTTITEEETLQFAVNVSDPGADNLTYYWDFGDGTGSSNPASDHHYPDDGLFKVKLRVDDDDGGWGADSILVTVENLPPTASAGGPYFQTILIPVEFKGEAEDPGIEDTLTVAWDLDADGIFEMSGLEVSHAFADTGHYTVVFRVEDDDDAVVLDSTWVLITNEPPVVEAIPPQVIIEGGTFDPVELDDSVYDPDQNDSALEWSVKGQVSLIVQLENRILTGAPPDSEWAGQEILVLKVTDPGGLQDSVSVSYTVLTQNDPPVWQNIPDFSFIEDDTLLIPMTVLRSRVMDVDDDTSSMEFHTEEHVVLTASIGLGGDMMRVVAPPNWYGETDLVFIVTDPAGATDKDTSRVTVVSRPDPPGPFSLIEPLYAEYDAWPDTVLFHWHASQDPDLDDMLLYKWTLRTEGGTGTMTWSETVLDTVIVFEPDETMETGTYVWWVTVQEESDSTQESNVGTLIVGIPSAVEGDGSVLPDAFRLFQNYPNPFNPETSITIHLPESSSVRLAIYNMMGQEVRVLVDGRLEAGIHTFTWDGRNSAAHMLPAGLYISRMITPSMVFYRKMLYIQ